MVTRVGSNFLAERTSDDALTLGNKPVAPEFVLRWANQTIELFVPSGHGTGPLEVKVKTLGGEATGTLTVIE